MQWIFSQRSSDAMHDRVSAMPAQGLRSIRIALYGMRSAGSIIKRHYCNAVVVSFGSEAVLMVAHI